MLKKKAILFKFKVNTAAIWCEYKLNINKSDSAEKWLWRNRGPNECYFYGKSELVEEIKLWILKSKDHPKLSE